MKTILMKIIFQLIFEYVERFYFGNSIFIINKEQKRGFGNYLDRQRNISSLGILDTGPGNSLLCVFGGVGFLYTKGHLAVSLASIH